MPTYVIALLDVHDPGEFGRYAEMVMPTLAAYGGTALIAADNAETLEGRWPRERTVVISFESEEAARTWYDSPEYREAKAVRAVASSGDLILARGIDEGQ